MKKSLRVDAEAEEELSHAIDRYENEGEGLGLEFWTEVSEAMDALDEPGPECGPVLGLPPELSCCRGSRTLSSSSRATRSCALSRSCTGIDALPTGVAASDVTRRWGNGSARGFADAATLLPRGR